MSLIGYDCPEHGRRLTCDVDEHGERRCPECWRAVTAIHASRGRRSGV